jgi:hypothetical protein
MKIRLVGAEFSHTDGRTDMTKRIVAFRNFALVKGNGKVVPVHTVKANRGIGGIAAIIVNPGTRWS